ncbi:MAG: tetratricopeptide repeat protein [Chloroflexi bacterium]|nr:tetratricopeptide repeat protein [Chloroflexota bacterium]
MTVASRPYNSSKAPARQPSAWAPWPRRALSLTPIVLAGLALAWPRLALLCAVLSIVLAVVALVRRAWQPTPVDAGLWLLALGSLVGYVVAVDPGARDLRLSGVLASLAVFTLAVRCSSAPRATRFGGRLFVVAVLVGLVITLGLLQGQLPDNTITRRLSLPLSLFRAFPPVQGDIFDVNSRFPVHQYGVAFLLLLAVPFGVAGVVFGPSLLRRVLAGVAVVVAMALLAATEARGALLAAAVAAAALASFRGRWFWALVPVGLALVVGLMTAGIINRSIEASWLQARLSIWSRTLSMLGDFPLSGAGLGMRTFARVFAYTFGLPDPYQVVHSHNILLQAYAEQGLLGLVGLLLALGAGLALALRGARSAAPTERPLAAAVFAALLGAVVYGLTDQVPTTDFGLVALLALAGLGVGIDRRSAAGREVSPVVQARLPRLVGPAGSVAVFLLLALTAPRWISGLELNAAAARLVGVTLGQLSADDKQRTLAEIEGLLQQATWWNRTNVAAFRNMGLARLEGHDVTGAMAAVAAAKASGNLNDYERWQLGRLADKAGFTLEAIALWRDAGRVDTLRAAAEQFAARNDDKSAEAAYGALVELEPDVPEHMSNLAKAVLASGGTPEEALGWFERAATLNPDARRSLSRQLVLEGEPCRINERAGGGRFDCAVFWFGLASKVDPSFDKPEVELGAVHYYAGRVLENAGQAKEATVRYLEAASHFQAASTRDPRNASTWHQLGQALDAAGRREEALAAFRRAVQERPNAANLHVSLGRVLAALGRSAEARQELETALRLDPNVPDAQAALQSLAGR